MNDTENDIVQLSKDFIAAQVGELCGSEDPKAFQMLKSEDGVLGVTLVDIPESDDERDLMADYLAAACCIHRAVEATFASSAWSSMYSSPAQAGIKPGQRDNRVEIVMLVHVTSQRIQAYTAAILRVNGTVRLSPWLAETAHCDSGRIPEALRTGIRLSVGMPQDLVKALNDAKADMSTGQILELFVNQIREVREKARRSAEMN